MPSALDAEFPAQYSPVRGGPWALAHSIMGKNNYRITGTPYVDLERVMREEMIGNHILARWEGETLLGMGYPDTDTDTGEETYTEFGLVQD